MGYTTDFEGHFDVTPPLSTEQVEYLNKLSRTRRMKRSAADTRDREDPVREAVGLPVGDEGGYFVGELGLFGQDIGPDVIEYNMPPAGQPGLWCQWEASEDGSRIQWNEQEKFYKYIDWLEYIVRNFIIPWERTINGEVIWSGECESDTGTICARDNNVMVTEDRRL